MLLVVKLVNLCHKWKIWWPSDRKCLWNFDDAAQLCVNSTWLLLSKWLVPYASFAEHLWHFIMIMFVIVQGLGKTIQTIAFFAQLLLDGVKGPHVIIAPTSTIGMTLIVFSVQVNQAKSADCWFLGNVLILTWRYVNLIWIMHQVICYCDR